MTLTLDWLSATVYVGQNYWYWLVQINTGKLVIMMWKLVCKHTHWKVATLNKVAYWITYWYWQIFVIMGISILVHSYLRLRGNPQTLTFMKQV